MNDISDTPPSVKLVLTNSVQLPKKPRVTIWHWVQYYAYNWARKPMVWRAKRRAKQIEVEILTDLHALTLQEIMRNVQQGCDSCRDAYGALAGQVFLSQIRLAMIRLKCPDHPEPFLAHLSRNNRFYNESERVTAYINGFGPR